VKLIDVEGVGRSRPLLCEGLAVAIVTCVAVLSPWIRGARCHWRRSKIRIEGSASQGAERGDPPEIIPPPPACARW